MKSHFRYLFILILVVCCFFAHGSFSEEEKWICPNCNAERTTDFCPDCGTKKPETTEWICPNCGTTNTSRFCANCGTAKPTPSLSGHFDDVEIEISYNNRNRKGTYSGDLINGLPSGQGTFTSDDNYGQMIYTGAWDNGVPSSQGNLDSKEYTIYFDSPQQGKFERTTEYKGETLNGIPSGTGYAIAVNSEGIKFFYNGSWADGIFNGFGETVYDTNPVSHQKGNYVNGDFTPTYSQLIDTLISLNNGYFMTDEQIAYITDNEDLFCTRPKSIPKKKLANSFDSAKFIKSNKTENKLVKVGGTVAQITSFDLFGYKMEEMIYLGNKGTIYYGYLYGETDLVAESKTTLYIFPISHFKYQTVENVYKEAILCAFIKTK